MSKTIQQRWQSAFGSPWPAAFGRADGKDQSWGLAEAMLVLAERQCEIMRVVDGMASGGAPNLGVAWSTPEQLLRRALGGDDRSR